MPSPSIPSRLDFSGNDLHMPLVGNSGFDSFSSPLGLGMHTHDGYELTYVFEGRVSWEIDSGELLTLSGDDMAITQPHVPHRGYMNIIQPASIFWLDFSPHAVDAARGTGLSTEELAAIDTVFRRAGHAVQYAGGALRPDLTRLHDTLRPLVESRTGGDLARIRCRALIVQVLAAAADTFARGGSWRTSDRHASAAVAYIKEHMRSPVSMPEVARHVGISVSRLHAVFKERLGMTPNDYLQRLRVDTACALLTTSHQSISRLALDLGFSSSQYFSTCFRRYTGMSPREFRRERGRHSATDS